MSDWHFWVIAGLLAWNAVVLMAIWNQADDLRRLGEYFKYTIGPEARPPMPQVRDD